MEACEKLLLHFRSTIIQDSGRIRAAVELSSHECPVLMAGPLDLQERWLAALLAGTDAQAGFSWSDAGCHAQMGNTPIQQVKNLASSLSAVLGREWGNGLWRLWRLLL